MRSQSSVLSGDKTLPVIVANDSQSMSSYLCLIVNIAVSLFVFTALHVMQTRYSEENSVRPSVRLSVCLSVRLSHAWIVTKRWKDLSRFIYHTKEHLS